MFISFLSCLFLSFFFFLKTCPNSLLIAFMQFLPIWYTLFLWLISRQNNNKLNTTVYALKWRPTKHFPNQNIIFICFKIKKKTLPNRKEQTCTHISFDISGCLLIIESQFHWKFFTHKPQCSSDHFLSILSTSTYFYESREKSKIYKYLENLFSLRDLYFFLYTPNPRH